VEATREILATRHAPAQKLVRVIEMHLRHFQESKDFFGIFLREDLDFLDANAETDLRGLVRTYDALWDEVLQEGIAAGVFDAEMEVPIVRKAIIGMCNGTYTWYRADGPYPIQEIARQFAAFALDGLRPRATSDGAATQTDFSTSSTA